MASPTKRFLAGFLFLLTTLLFTIIGIAIALFYDTNCDVVYESRAVFQITPNWVASEDVSDEKVQQLVQFCDTNHDQMIASPKVMGKCFDEFNFVRTLNSFEDLAGMEACVAQTLANLEISEVGADSNIYKLVLRTSDPDDAQTILNCLVTTYEQTLEQSFPSLEAYTAYTIKRLENARYGEQVWPILPLSLATVVFPAIVLATVIWFLANPFKFSYPRITLLEWLALFLMTAIFVATSLGLAWWVEGASEYESSATVLFENVMPEAAKKSTPAEKRLVEISDIPHETLFRQYSNIERALERHNLFRLDMLEDISKEDGVELVQQNLNIKKMDDSGVHKVTFRSANPGDCHTVLNNLIASYSKSLETDNQIKRDRKRTNEIAKRHMPDQKNEIDELGESIVVNASILQPASEAQAVSWKPKMVEPLIVLGAFAALFSLVLWLAWRATRDDTQDKRGLANPV